MAVATDDPYVKLGAVPEGAVQGEPDRAAVEQKYLDLGAIPEDRPPEPGAYGPNTYQPPAPSEPQEIPPAFLHRLAWGAALDRVLAPFKATGKGAAAAFGSDPFGFSPETVHELQDAGIYRDPVTGRGGPVRLLNEAMGQGVIGPTVNLLSRSFLGAVGGVAGAVRQAVEDASGLAGNPEQAEDEVRNFANYMILRGDIAEFSRFGHGERGPLDQKVGPIPRDQDFQTAAQLLAQRTGDGDLQRIKNVEENLRSLWQVRGIHPAEVVGDVKDDALLHHDLQHPPANKLDQSGIPHPIDTPVPEGTPRSELAKTGEAHIDRVIENETVKNVIDSPIIDDTHEIPNSWGGSVPLSDPTTFIDREFPRSLTIDGVTFDPAHAAVIHENVEEFVINKLMAAGIPRDAALRSAYWGWGNPAEHAWYRAHGMNPEHVEEAIKPFLDAIASRKANAANIPANLFRETYPGANPLKNTAGTIEKPSKEEIAQAKEIIGAERIVAAAIKTDQGNIMIGRTHAEIVEKPDFSFSGNVDGFLTSTGRFVDRHEAAEIANKVGQAPISKTNRFGQNKLEVDDLDQPLVEEEGTFHPLGADVAGPDTSFAQQPPRPPGRIIASVQAAGEKLFDIGRDLQMLTVPMARGSKDAMATAKDFANQLRWNRWEWSRFDDQIAKNFNPEQRERMWNAADEESVLRQEGQTSEHIGLATLTPQERAAVEELQSRSQIAWLRARDLGMVEGEGLPAYTPRMVVAAATAAEKDGSIALNAIGQNLHTRTAQMLHRQHLTAEETEAAAQAKLGEGAKLVRDIRVLPLATAKLEDAIAGRTLINSIREIGARTGEDTVADGFKPAESASKWFTLDHPAMRTWKPRLRDMTELEAAPFPPAGRKIAVRDEDGNIVFEQRPLYIRGDFEGPLRAVLSQKSGATYSALMSAKGKTMGLIMNSPLIHNAVEWGRALPAMPGKVATFKIYFEGNRAKNDVGTMREAINSGLVPIGHRFFNQDISSIAEAPNLTPGRSWTAQVLGAIPGLFDPAAGNAVKAAIDKAGNFWHNTLLWDRVGDLQMGLYTNFRDDLVAKGVDGQTAARAAAHWANRYAGALPVEAMSANARKIANVAMFSRSFTLGNLGAMKDAMTGLPKDVLAQIERDMGEVNPEAVGYAKAMARRKAAGIIALDIGLMYVGNSLLQNAMNVMLGDSTLDKEMHGYAARLSQMLTETKENPLKLLQPLNLMQSLSSTSENEPGKQDRVRVGYAKDGTAIYMRNPAGKIGEEFIGYLSGPLDMFRRKLGTLARPAWQIVSNDKGFGRKVYDPDADTVPKYIGNVAKIVEHLVESQAPTGQIGAISDLVKGEGDAKVNALQGLGPVAGVTFSKGAPGGPAIGELYHAREQHDYAVQAELPDLRKQIQRGDVAGAQKRMGELGIPPGLQKFYIRTSINPATRLTGRTLKDFYRYATPEQRERLQNAR